MKRESFGSRLGFILVSAGCAIGIGNIYRFPYIAGQNGGSVFVLFYLLFLLCMGVPVLTMELAVGRASKQSAVLGYKALEKPGSKWHIHGWFCVIGCYLLMMCYTTIAGWMFGYFIKYLTGTFEGIAPSAISGVFYSMLEDPLEMTAWMAVIVIAGFLVCSFGLKNGLERISKFMMTALLLLIIILAINSIRLPGAGEGLKFYLLPDFERAASVGLGNVITAAMNQAFFTLSLGIGAMEIFGSYMSGKNTLAGESFRICILDTFVALFSGLIIFPACYAFNVQPDAGPMLVFATIPNVFVNMAGGRLWGTLFFLLMTFASFTTVIAVFENLLSACIDNFGWTRKKAVIFNLILILAASMPAILGYNAWSHILPFRGMNFMDTEDFLVSNLFLPLGSMIYLLFCTTKWGWGFDQYLAEANKGEGLKLPGGKAMKIYLRFIVPAMILFIMIQGWA